MTKTTHSVIKVRSTVTLGSILAVCALAVSCGRIEDSHTDSKVQVWNGVAQEKRFSLLDIAQVHSTATEVVGGKTFPVSKPALKRLYTAKTAPKAFAEEWGEFTSAAEVKGFLNTGVAISPEYSQRVIGNLEALSKWKLISDTKGDPVFKDSYSTNAKGEKVPDTVDGKATAAGEEHLGKLVLQAPFGKVTVPVSLTLYERDGILQGDLLNTAKIKAPIVGTVIKDKMLRMHLKFFPHKNGWLVYGAAAVKLEQFQDALKPEEMNKMVDGLFTWIKKEVVQPL